MNKNEFLNELRQRAGAIPEEELEETINYYSEMIDDRVEDGDTEEQAVEAMGSIDEILEKSVQEKHPHTEAQGPSVEISKSSNGIKAVNIVLIAVTFPIWFPIIISLFSVAVSIAAALISIVASAAALFIGSFASMMFYFTEGRTAEGMFMLGTGMAGIGISILMTMLFVFLIRKVIGLCKRFIAWIKNKFSRKDVQYEKV